jgi:hypothetical protein
VCEPGAVKRRQGHALRGGGDLRSRARPAVELAPHSAVTRAGHSSKTVKQRYPHHPGPTFPCKSINCSERPLYPDPVPSPTPRPSPLSHALSPQRRILCLSASSRTSALCTCPSKVSGAKRGWPRDLQLCPHATSYAMLTRRSTHPLPGQSPEPLSSAHATSRAAIAARSRASRRRASLVSSLCGGGTLPDAERNEDSNVPPSWDPLCSVSRCAAVSTLCNFLRALWLGRAPRRLRAAVCPPSPAAPPPCA